MNLTLDEQMEIACMTELNEYPCHTATLLRKAFRAYLHEKDMNDCLTHWVEILTKQIMRCKAKNPTYDLNAIRKYF